MNSRASQAPIKASGTSTTRCPLMLVGHQKLLVWYRPLPCPSASRPLSDIQTSLAESRKQPVRFAGDLRPQWGSKGTVCYSVQICRKLVASWSPCYTTFAESLIRTRQSGREAISLPNLECGSARTHKRGTQRHGDDIQSHQFSLQRASPERATELAGLGTVSSRAAADNGAALHVCIALGTCVRKDETGTGGIRARLPFRWPGRETGKTIPVPYAATSS